MNGSAVPEGFEGKLIETDSGPCLIPAVPLEQWGPAAAGTENIGYYYVPKIYPGWKAYADSISLKSINTTSGVYDAAVAPEWLVCFLDSALQATPIKNGIVRNPAAALRSPLQADVKFFELSGVFAVVSLTNGGNGYPFPQRAPDRYEGLYLQARRIGTNTTVRVQPQIVYRRAK